MRHLKTFEQKTNPNTPGLKSGVKPQEKADPTLLDKIGGFLKDKVKKGVKKGGMYFITNSDKFEKLTKLKDIQQVILKNDLDKNGEPQTMGGEAAKKMVNMYNQNISLLDSTIDKYISGKITKEQVKNILDKKIEEIKQVPTGPLADAKEFKNAAIDFLNWLRSDVSPWLI